MISEKQLKILAFPYTKYDALICDGSIRSGKTSLMTVAFVDWAMDNFNGQNFIILGKTVGSATRNVVKPYRNLSRTRKRYKTTHNKSENLMTVTRGSVTNYFMIFGAKDESAYELIQGFTAAGALIDEAALCVESAVNQALGRCSVAGSKFWFNCNPESPSHWFYREWICKLEEKNALHLHFELRDNPSLSEEIIQRYERMYSGVFYKRYILGLWVMAEGLIYPNFEDAFEKTYTGNGRSVVSIDYGIQNAFAAKLWRYDGKIWHATKEYHHSGRDTGFQKTDNDYLEDIVDFCEGIEGEITVIVDPSATSFIAALRKCKKRRFKVKKAKNDVLDGIKHTLVCIQDGLIKISEECEETRKEFGGYVWDDKKDDQPLKVNDHHMDETRYFVETIRPWKGKKDYESAFGS